MPTRLRFLTVAIFGCVGLSFAAEPVKSGSLSNDDIAAGWISLFDGESTFGWKVEGEATVKDGKLIVGGEKATKLTTTTSFPAGTVRKNGVDAAHPGGPIVLEAPAGKPVGFSTIALRIDGFQPLFNGKDLSGWKVYTEEPAKNKATFTVTPAGELHVFGGPGDIRTEKNYADFVLQTEVKTAGPTVNSGIFFRSVPGQYQNGYECQVQNAIKDSDRTKPADFGTGAIYRRTPARKVVSNDNEWFTLTLIANGPHISTWVNGYQVVDWTDDRPRDENPRKGLRTDAGHLSIQGHAPPTSADVLFRNLRIVEWKK